MRRTNRCATIGKGFLIFTVASIWLMVTSNTKSNGKFVVTAATTTMTTTTVRRRKQQQRHYKDCSTNDLCNEDMDRLQEKKRWSAIPTTSITFLPPYQLRMKDQSTWRHRSMANQFPTHNALLLDDLATLQTATNQKFVSKSTKLRRFFSQGILMAMNLTIASLLSTFCEISLLPSIASISRIPAGNVLVMSTMLSTILSVVKSTVVWLSRQLQRFLWWEFWRIVWKWSTPLLWDALGLSKKPSAMSEFGQLPSLWLEHGWDWFDSFIRRGTQKWIQKWVEKAVEHNIVYWIGSFCAFLTEA
jgi:hypothetical protein